MRFGVRLDFGIVSAVPDVPVFGVIDINELRQDGDFCGLWQIGPDVFHGVRA